MSPCRRYGLAATFALALLGAGAYLLRSRVPGAVLAGDGYRCPGCSVVLISVDTLRADHLGLYGYARPTSPRIDRLGETAVVFEDVTAQAPWTLSSHMSLLTGLYSSHHGVVDRVGRNRLPDDVPTLPGVLQGQGYLTAAFTGGGYVSQAYNYHGFARFDDSGGPTGANFPALMDWLAEHARDRFLLFWHDFTVHCPYDPPRAYDLFSDPAYAGVVSVAPDADEPLCAGDPTGTCTAKCSAYYGRLLERMSDADLRHVIAKYDGQIRLADERIGALLDRLDASGRADRTVVVLVSDHGESFADRPHRRRIGHHLMYQEVLRVPLVLRVPGAAGGRRVAEPVELIDVMPTVLDIVGVPAPERLDGRSLLRGHGPVGPHPFSEHFADGREEYALRDGARKLLSLTRGRELELYDLAADPGERHDLHGTDAATEARLRRRLVDAMRRPRAAGAPAAVAPETRARLRALGYAD